MIEATDVTLTDHDLENISLIGRLWLEHAGLPMSEVVELARAITTPASA